MSKNPISICEYIDSLPLLKDLDRRTLVRLGTEIKAIDAPKGTVLVRRGDVSAGLHVVVFGQVKLYLQTVRGTEKVVALLDRGESFGESEMFLNHVHRVCAESLTDSKLIHVGKQTVLAEIERDPQFARWIIARLSARLHHFIGEVEGYTLRSGTERVIAYLLKLLPEHFDDASAITFPVQKRIIASHLNLTHEHFSRILRELTGAGLIEVRGRVVHIYDAQQLRSHAT